MPPSLSVPALMVLVPPRAWTDPVEGLARMTVPALTTTATELLSTASARVPRVSVPEPFLVMVPPPVWVERVRSPVPPTT